MKLCNFHTHTQYSDGKNTPTEMIEAAIRLGFSVLGFSDHTYTHARESFPMTIEGEASYRREIRELAARYADTIRIYCGVEQDSESALPIPGDYDFILSSVHEIIYHGDFYPIDNTVEIQRALVNNVFGGSFVEMSKYYFDKLTEHVMRQKTDIIGHLDLVTKYGLIPEDDAAYVDAALEAVREMVKHCRLFELNTGAISRGLRTVPYPAAFIVDEIKRLGGAFIINSDCHDKDKLTVWFEEGGEFLTEHGFICDVHANLNACVEDIVIWR